MEKTHNTEGLGAENISMFFSNSIANKKGFLPRPARFRGWTGAGGVAGGYNAPGLPDLSGYVPAVVMSESTVSATGPFSVGPVTYTDAVNPGQGQVHRSIIFNASHVSAIYGASPTVMPASIDLPVILYLGNSA